MEKSLRDITDTLNDLAIVQESTVITEAKGHLDHPEDAIFIGGSSYANTAVKAIVDTSQQPEIVTI
jgi:hypothetical protein